MKAHKVKEKDETKTMQARIDAFYAQSGGPNNPQIDTLMERHLLYAKDHGTRGAKETVEDAFIDTIMGDPSLIVLMQRIARWRSSKVNASGANDLSSLENRIRQLESEVRELKDLLQLQRPKEF